MQYDEDEGTGLAGLGFIRWTPPTHLHAYMTLLHERNLLGQAKTTGKF